MVSAGDVDGIQSAGSAGRLRVRKRAVLARKVDIELAAFRLGMAPASEMNDHKMYFDANDIWPLLVRAGFIPQYIRVGKHKFGFNTYAICRIPGSDIAKT